MLFVSNCGLQATLQHRNESSANYTNKETARDLCEKERLDSVAHKHVKEGSHILRCPGRILGRSKSTSNLVVSRHWPLSAVAFLLWRLLHRFPGPFWSSPWKWRAGKNVVFGGGKIRENVSVSYFLAFEVITYD